MRRHLSFVALVLGAVVATLAASRAAADSDIEVGLDNARIVVLDTAASDIIIGNPAYADVTLQSPRRLIFFGKKVGQTNIIILDDRRREILSGNLVVVPNSDIRVRAPGKRTVYYTCGGGRCATSAVGAKGRGLGGGVEEAPLPAEETQGGKAAGEEAVGEQTEEVIE